MYKIAPSILSADFAKLGEEITKIIQAGANWIHFDVMDNHYVPNLTIGPDICKAIKPYAKDIPLDVHLMATPVDNLIIKFAQSGANIITFHPEASSNVNESLNLIKNFNLQAGLVLSPQIDINIIKDFINKLDLILIMSVNPGLGGQQFIENTYDKIKAVKNVTLEHYNKTGKKILIEVDGGIKINNIGKIASCGADIFVAGSAIFKSPNYKNTIDEFNNELKKITNKNP